MKCTLNTYENLLPMHVLVHTYVMQVDPFLVCMCAQNKKWEDKVMGAVECIKRTVGEKIFPRDAKGGEKANVVEWLRYKVCAM